MAAEVKEPFLGTQADQNLRREGKVLRSSSVTACPLSLS